VTFDREKLHAAIEAVLSTEGETKSIEAVDKTKWLISKDAGGKLVAVAGSEAVPLPDFDCLSPTPSVRLEWFERQVKTFHIDSRSSEKWRRLLAARRCDDEEVEELRKEFRLTPRWFARALLEGADGEADVPIASLVPSDSRYYYRLAGCPIEGDLLSYVRSGLSSHIDRQVAGEGVNGVAFSLLLSAHQSIPQEIKLHEISRDQVKHLFEWLEAHGDRISQLGSIELGLACLDTYPELEPVITKMTRMFIEDDDGEAGRLAQLAGLVVLVDGELARTGILRAHPPYWRRLAAIAHASLLERELLRRGANIGDFSSWAYPNRSQHYFLQNSVDLRREPRWLPEFLSSDQLKAEFVGRISVAMVLNRDKIRSSELQSLALDKAGPLQSLIVFPAPYLPGPLEGGVDATQPMPADIEQQVDTGLKADVVTPQSFLGLVNTALIFKLGPQMADLAAEALRRAKYQLRGVGDDVPALGLLHGLAIVAAVTRSDGLAAEVRVLVRVVRRRPGAVMELSDAFRIVMMAAAAHEDIEKWCIFVGDWLTELAYEDLTRSEARALSSRIRALCQIERRLWGTCARADAACASLSAA
jgi:hypothetical protein